MDFSSFASDPNIFYVAFSAFFIAVLLELYLRAKRMKREAHERPFSDRMEKVLHYFAERKTRTKITNDVYQKLTGVSDSTATRDLQKLVELGLLEKEGVGRGIHYRMTKREKRRKPKISAEKLPLTRKTIARKRVTEKKKKKV